jgi:hypothetical protein
MMIITGAVGPQGHKGQWDHKDPAVKLDRKAPQDQKAQLGLTVSKALKETGDQLGVHKGQRVTLVHKDRRVTLVHKARRVTLDNKVRRVILAPKAFKDLSGLKGLKEM